MYPDSFNHIIAESSVPLMEWIKGRNLKYDEAAKQVGFQKVTIAKMLKNENRDIRVWADCELVEVKKLEVKAIHVQGEMIGYPTNQNIILVEKLFPKGKMEND